MSCSVADSRRTMLISETAQALKRPTDYRSVTAIDCKQKPADGQNPQEEMGLLFSMFGLSPEGPLPKNVEIIAFDAAQGIFNYYETDGNKLNFFGTSKDMLKGAAANGDRRCGGCHTGGGLVMKELQAPWLHWEGDTTTPGHDDLVKKHQDRLGRPSDGIDLEAIVRAGNTRWNAAKIAHLKDLGVTKELLRPLFCNVQVNIVNASSLPQESTEGIITSLPLSGPVLDNRVAFGTLEGDAESYDAILRANGQSIGGLPDGFIETHFGLPFVTGSAEDDDYVNQLMNEGIIDIELVEDVLMVDFTRPVFSEDRCGLLELVPKIDVKDLNAANVKAALIEAIGNPADGTPAKELLNNLKSDRDKPSTASQAFVSACTARLNTKLEVSFTKDGQQRTITVPAVLADYMKIVSLNRDTARERQVFEFPQTMPNDELTIAKASRLHPTTCEITTQFVAVALDPALSCEARCGEAAGQCSCAPECEAAGNCCVNFRAECVREPCGHELCSQGTALRSNCIPAPAGVPDDCVRKICDADTFCCESNWDGNCVGEVESICGFTCPAPPPPPNPEPTPTPTCCQTCTAGKACGDACIPETATCNSPPGCACDG
jgi:hypothetical protein